MTVVAQLVGALGTGRVGILHSDIQMNKRRIQFSNTQKRTSRKQGINYMHEQCLWIIFCALGMFSGDVFFVF